MPPKMKMWTTELEFQLIHEVRSRPMLWDISLAEYRRNDLKEVHWEEVAKKLGPNISSEMAKKRFTNMRDTLMDNNKRVKESKRSGTGAENVYKPKWPLFESLLFLLKTVAQAESVSNLDVTECQSKDSAITDSDNSTLTSVEAYATSSLNFYYDENLQQLMVLPPETTGTSQSSLPGSNTPVTTASTTGSSASCSSSASAVWSEAVGSAVAFVPSPLSSPDYARPSSEPPLGVNDASGLFKKRGVKRTHNPLAEEALKVMNKIVNEPVAPPENDAAEKFGAFVASKLREMDPERRNICESKIVKALYE